VAPHYSIIALNHLFVRISQWLDFPPRSAVFPHTRVAAAQRAAACDNGIIRAVPCRAVP